MSEYVPVRFSHLLGFAGVGSFVRSDSWLYTIMDISQWSDHDWLPYVERVIQSLDINRELHLPPKGAVDPNGRVQGATVPGIRFPSWMRCRACGLMHWKAWTKMHDPKTGPACVGCGKPLEQFPWVMIDSEGRMDDVPWHFLLHRGGSCKEIRREPHLRLIDRYSSSPTALRLRATAGTAGTAKRWILCCEHCKRERHLDEKEAQYQSPKFDRHQPWLKNDLPGDGGAEIQVVDVSDPRLYAAVTVSALVIPPESRVRRGSVLDRLYCNRNLLEPIRKARRPELPLKRAASELGCSIADVREAWQEICRENGYPLYGQVFTPGQLIEDEYRAITTPFDPADDEDFVTFHRTAHWRELCERIPEWFHLIASISHLIEIKRLREIRVFKGFTRAHGETTVPPDIIGALDWLPAIELFGEGLFFTLDGTLLRSWERQAGFKTRVEILQRRYAQSGLSNRNDVWLPGGRITPRFMLLHTLAHLLIRQVEATAGYPAASLKERLYCGPDMAGILIYVAVPDIAGSLGGLSELSAPERFLGLLDAALTRADWCSLDPVCSEHEGQGAHLLNFAACHGCALIPEPACLFGNELLDRAFVKGDDGLGVVGILEHAAGYHDGLRGAPR